MQFMPKLTEFLRDNGFIYTVRGYDMDHKWVLVEGVGWCERFPLGLIRDWSILSLYYRDSGFESITDWTRTIRVFIKDGKPAWLYKVEMRERE